QLLVAVAEHPVERGIRQGYLICRRLNEDDTFAHGFENASLGLQCVLLDMPLGHLGDVDHRAENPAICLHGTCTQFEVSRSSPGVDDDLVKITGLARGHDMLKYFVHVSTVGWRRKILYRSADPALRRNAVHRTIEEYALPLPIEQRKPIRGARCDGLQR